MHSGLLAARDARFVIAFYDGFGATVKDSAVRIVEAKFGNMGKKVETRLVEDILQVHGNAVYFSGTAVPAVILGAFSVWSALTLCAGRSADGSLTR